VAASVAERPADLELLGESGVVVYLRARPETLAGRMGTGEGRPWLQQNPLEWITATLARRDDAYQEAADVVIDVDGLTPRTAAARLTDMLVAPASAWTLAHGYS
jgi:shikimate kinase